MDTSIEHFNGLIMLLMVILAFLVDNLIGDPKWLPHPVVGIGKIIAKADNVLNKGSGLSRKMKGMLLTLALVAGVFLLTQEILRLFKVINPFFGWGVEVILISTALAGKTLHQAGSQIAEALKADQFAEARTKMRWLVSRDSSQLQEPEIVRGTVESLFENFVDGFLSPFMFALLGGAPLVLAFKAVSTLDSMIGYRNERYRDFGWFAARTDDWANYLPARLAVPVLLLAGAFHRLNVRRGFKTWRQDAHKHPSPNGGHPESAGAGLLGVKLGGLNVYHGRTEYREEMGEALNPLTPQVIDQSLSLIRTASWIIWGMTAFIAGIMLVL